MNDFLLRLKKFVVQYREWLVIALLMIGIFYLMLQYRGLQKSDIEREVYDTGNVRAQQQETLNYQAIVDGVMEIPEPYLDLVKFNPFEDIDNKRGTQDRIAQSFAEAMRYFTAGSYLDAKEKFQEVLKLDPFEARLDYRPRKPSKMIEDCEREAKRQSIRAVYDKGIEKFRQVTELDQPGGISEEELLTLYTEVQQLLRQVVQEGQELAPEAYEDSRAKLEGVDKRADELKIILFSALLDRLYSDAVDLWNRKDEKTSNLADARDNLMRIDQMIASYEKELSPDDKQIQTQTQQLLTEVSREVDRVYPVLLQQAGQLESSGQGNLDQLAEAQEIYRVLYRFRQEQPIQDKVDQLETVLVDLRRQAMIRQAQRWLEEGKQFLEAAKQAYAEGNWDQMSKSKNEGSMVLQRIGDLPEITELESVRAERVKVQQELDALRLLPAIEGLILQGPPRGDRAQVLDQATNRRSFLRLGARDPITGLTFTRIGRQEGGVVRSIFVSKDGFRETEVFQEGQ